MTVFTKSADRDPLPGEYVKVVLDGEVTARLGCPGCGRPALLDHEIDSYGNVTPSVECGYDDCDFHETGTLVGWKG